MTKKKKVALIGIALSALGSILKVVFDIDVPVPDGLAELIAGAL